MTKEEAIVGTRVKSLRQFANVPEETEGIIDEDYGNGIMVAWDFPDKPLPKGYYVWDGKPSFSTGILRYGFDKETELQYLEIVNT